MMTVIRIGNLVKQTYGAWKETIPKDESAYYYRWSPITTFPYNS